MVGKASINFYLLHQWLWEVTGSYLQGFADSEHTMHRNNWTPSCHWLFKLSFPPFFFTFWRIYALWFHFFISEKQLFNLSFLARAFGKDCSGIHLESWLTGGSRRASHHIFWWLETQGMFGTTDVHPAGQILQCARSTHPHKQENSGGWSRRLDP